MQHWNSRRSAVLSKNGICSSSQPLASAAGVRILRNGGTAADAAVAMAAALNVLEPCSTGIGGDAFALYYEATTKAVHCLCGNGSSSAHFSLDLLNSRNIGIKDGQNHLDPHSGLCVTVPGAAALWENLVEKYGRLTLSQVLLPAIELAEEGFPISQITAQQWASGFIQGEEAERVLKPGGSFPKAGELIRNVDLAETFRTISEVGTKDGFYNGRIAEAIVDAVQSIGGVLDKDDLDSHRTEFPTPISIVYKGIRVYETPPPTQGLAALIALGLIDCVQQRLSAETVVVESLDAIRNENSSNSKSTNNHHQNSFFFAEDANLADRGSAEEAHISIECMRLAFADALQYIADPSSVQVPVEQLLSKSFLNERSKLVDLNVASDVHASVDLFKHSNGDTVYFCCVDSHGNACSMINSNYQGFLLCFYSFLLSFFMSF
jgi:gamma-glutamyltranspeptidase/glutathione hydrolase